MKKENGITLIALTITIIVLLILAGVTVATLTGDNGLLTKAGQAKKEQIINTEKEQLELSVESNKIYNNGNYNSDNVKDYINAGIGKEISKIKRYDNNIVIVSFYDNNNFKIDSNGIVQYIGNETIKDLDVNYVDSNMNILKKLKIYNLNGEVDVEEKFISEEGLEYRIAEKTKIEKNEDIVNVKYYLVCKDEKTLIFNDYEGGYKIGNGQNILNGMNENYNNVECIIEIPEKINKLKVKYITKFSFANNRKIKELVLSNNIEKIDVNAFMDCTGLEKITFGNKLEALANGGGIFNRCSKLNINSFNVSEDNENFKVKDGILYNYECSKIILFPLGETGNYVIPDHVDTIGNYAFYSCKLDNIYIPKSIKNWGISTFKESKVNTLNLQCNEIPSLAFWYAPLEHVTIGVDCKKINTNSFIDMNNLKEINYEGTIEQWNNITKGYSWSNRCMNLKVINCINGKINI